MIKKEYEQAAKCFLRAAEQGYAKAQYNLGVCYEFGLGVEKNEAEAVKWYQKAVEQGHADAQSNLGACYERGLGVKKSTKKAFEYYEAAAGGGSAIGVHNLGRCYEYGIGINKDFFVAQSCYKIAMKEGEEEAQKAYQRVYRENEKGYKLCLKYARKGDLECQCLAASHYRYGYGVEEDPEKAYYWYKKAADRGHEKAQKALRKLGWDAE